MKKLLGSIIYTFDNFYNKLNTQGQMIFFVIIVLIIILFIMLIITNIYQKVKNKKLISKINDDYKNTTIVNETNVTETTSTNEDNDMVSKNTIEIKDIADKIDKALNDNNTPVTLTNFEEDQERTAIISIDELMLKAKELEIVDDEQTGVNYLEKYNLEPAEVEEIVNKTTNKKSSEVKAFKVSQVISPVYGIRKEIDDDKKDRY